MKAVVKEEKHLLGRDGGGGEFFDGGRRGCGEREEKALFLRGLLFLQGLLVLIDTMDHCPRTLPLPPFAIGLVSRRQGRALLQQSIEWRALHVEENARQHWQCLLQSRHPSQSGTCSGLSCVDCLLKKADFVFGGGTLPAGVDGPKHLVQQDQRAVTMDGTIGERCGRRKKRIEVKKTVKEVVRREAGVVGEGEVIEAGADGEGMGGERAVVEGEKRTAELDHQRFADGVEESVGGEEGVEVHVSVVRVEFLPLGKEEQIGELR